MRTLRWAVWVLYLESLGVFAVTGLLIYDAIRIRTTHVGGAAGAIAFPFLVGVALAGFGWALRRRRAWARGPAIVLQLLMLPVGYYMLTGGAAWAGVPVILLGLIGAVLLFAPASREALGIH